MSLRSIGLATLPLAFRGMALMITPERRTWLGLGQGRRDLNVEFRRAHAEQRVDVAQLVSQACAKAAQSELPAAGDRQRDPAFVYRAALAHRDEKG
jgi:hypothetical protein